MTEAGKLRASLQDHNDADEESGEQDDGKRADADVVHLVEKILKIVRAADEVGEGTSGEDGIVLHVGDELHRAIGEHVENRDFVFPSRLLPGDLKRRLCHLSLVRKPFCDRPRASGSGLAP